MKTVLVIGSNCFTGSHFVNKCLNLNYKVIGISRSEEYQSAMLPYRYNKDPKNFFFFKKDINNDIKSILKIIDKYKPSIIANFSAQGEVRNSWKYPDQWYSTNCLSVVKLTNELVKRDFIERYITSSTPEVYGSTKKNIIENHNYYPSTPYAASKLAGDLHLFTLFKHYSFPVVFTRAANVYGPHQQLYRIIPRTIIYLKLGKIIELHGNGSSIRAFIHIKDAIDATMKIALNGNNGDVYHISPQDIHSTTILSLVKIICKISNKNFSDSTKLIDQNFGQDSVYSLNSDKLRNNLDWKPSIKIEQGIIETMDWINSNWETIKKMDLNYVHKK